VIGVASAPQASASGFRAPFTIPDAATAALGILLTVAVLAVYGRPSQPPDHSEIPWDMAWPAWSVVGGGAEQRQDRGRLGEADAGSGLTRRSPSSNS
jgi:hypothetical protein